MDIHALVCQLLAGTHVPDPGRWSDLHVIVGQPLRVRAGGMGLMEVAEASVSDTEFSVFAKRVTHFRDSDWSRQLDQAQDDLDCSATIQTEAGPVRFRANFFRHGAGLRLPGLVMRRIAGQVPAFDTLGLPAAVRTLGERASGLLLFTGVTGSGKSTSMAALLAGIAQAGSLNIITLEDPVEYLLSGLPSQVLQREVGAGKDCRSFAAGLRAALREDPDVIMVGEIRDAETAALALTAAQTGHLVLSTLHTRSAAQTVDRLVSMFPADARDDVRAQLAGSLLGVVSQMLLPGTDGGRVLAAEVMVATPAVANLIRGDKDGPKTHMLPTQIQQDHRIGSRLLNTQLLDLVRGGVVDREIALAATYDPAGLMADMVGR
ncbi:MAG: PilT/PilU family type 4a pilus ATPase [Proteobacteria bacterium]|nr:PilT/PilU family type 4a pilus ATPase [Pseudomonadota bacterium]